MSAAIDYYLAAFDKDFVNFRRPRIKKQIVQSSSNTPDPLAALTVSRPKLKEPVHHIKGVNKPEAKGWNDAILKSGFSAIDKPVEKWARIDLRRYVGHIYSVRWGGALLIGGTAQNTYSLVNEIITKVEHCFRTEIKQEGNQILKEYFDYFIETQVPSAALENGGMSWRKFSYQKYILAFTRQWKAKQALIAVPQSRPEVADVVPSHATPQLTLDALTTAYRTAPQVLVREFGVIVTINYLMMVRKQSLEKSLLYTQNVISKITPAEISEVLAATARYSPYPKWLAFTDVDKVIAVCNLAKPVVGFVDDSPAFGFLKDIV